jgi:carbon-monoxide dehydrogenase medium subunit
MKPTSFVRHVPKKLDEATEILAEVVRLDGRVIAGGQSLIPMMAFRMARPSHLVDINEVEGLDRLGVEGGKLIVGARVRHAAFHKPVVEGPTGAMLSTVVRSIAHYPIRMRGTMCGSLAHADPASEWCLTAATFDAEMVACSQAGVRIIAAKEFFEGIMATSLKDDEILAEVRLPILSPGTKYGFYEFSRRAGDFAMAASLVTYRVIDGRISAARVGIGGVEMAPRRLDVAEAALNGRPPDQSTFIAASQAAHLAVDPMEDFQTSAKYRRDLAATAVRRALEASAL